MFDPFGQEDETIKFQTKKCLHQIAEYTIPYAKA